MEELQSFTGSPINTKTRYKRESSAPHSARIFYFFKITSNGHSKGKTGFTENIP